ncbi:hypothetical protein Bbelb_309090 [Branchiostoma belcheri]|nr:hypothetical protein Bbelb_309090 [Branchiostoma belcheri]
MTNTCSDPTDIEVPGIDQSCPQAVANAINRHLASVSQQSTPLSLSHLQSFLPASVPPPVVSLWDMYHRLQRVKLAKASGVDGISTRLVREFAFKLSVPVRNIFNASLQEGTVPSMWKRADAIHHPCVRCAPYVPYERRTCEYGKVAIDNEIVCCEHIQLTYHLRNVRCTQQLTARLGMQTTLLHLAKPSERRGSDGTKLGPIVFLALINDASPAMEGSAEAWKYADDMTMSEARHNTQPTTF